MDENVKNILLNNGLEQYIDLFEEEKLMDLGILKTITENDYEKIGISSLGDRKKLLGLFFPKVEQPKVIIKQHKTEKEKFFKFLRIAGCLVIGFFVLMFLMTCLSIFLSRGN